ncbi:Lanosterol 14-alpha-demethylase [Boothiomyces macroporosus]|uniref:Lanosterol 14-alpha-demethylase n=1 Tax=Boothiomyces macroporosus TaxID=261099 RepID=A0AAD5UED7_9FUNG|nr:Lanosterol 14-alpha-demethylase [Boothiomyces macroporosus]
MGVAVDLYNTISEFLQTADHTTLILLAIAVIGASTLLFKTKATSANEPPMVPYTIPLLGSAIPYGIDPIKFLQDCRAKYGDCFTFMMMGRKMTFCLGPDGNHFVFNVPIANASAEGAYRTLTVPVFGTEVVYDVHNSVFMEQKKFVKDTFTSDAFKKYVPLIWEESVEFFNTFPKKGTALIFKEMSELTIRTAAACLMGKEIRSQLHSNVAQLYHDLDRGLAPINVFFRWLPLPTYFARDRAHNLMTETFKKIIAERRKNNIEYTDVLSTLMKSEYKNGTKMSDDAIAHLMIATLMGGQHTSSTTTSWILFELARRPDVIEEIMKEQSMILTGKPDTPAKDLPQFDYEQLRKMEFLDCVMKETLRLHTPIHTVMRKVEKNVTYQGFEIPKGHFLCGSQAVSQFDPVRFPDPEKFEPSRFLNDTEGNGEWTINGVNIAQKSARSHFLPFGAGRHRCIGEAFAYVQIKTIIAIFLRQFSLQLVKDNENQLKFPKADYTSLIVVPEGESYIQFSRREE